MHHVLRPHPDTPTDAVTGIEVEVSRSGEGALTLRYTVAGRIADLRLPAVTVPARANGLWQHTCFEAFVGPATGEGYYEFNFAPSTEWAAYSFDAYREGMADLGIEPPLIETRATADLYELTATFRLPGDGRLALSAVIEEANGRKSYWALAHPPGKADFHHSDSFTLQLPAA